MNNDKRALRKQIREMKRRFTPQELAEQSLPIMKALLADKAVAEARTILMYYSLPDEVDTHDAVNQLVRRGKTVLLPRVIDGENMEIRLYEKPEDLQEGSYGIMEPTGEPYRGAVDVTVVPLLAVNGNGYRLGYGGGFYDRYLKGKKTLKVGLGYAFQLTDELCEDGWDEPLDSFICERGIYYFGK